MQVKIGKFKFKVPEGHSEAGKKIEKSFEFSECDTEQEASKVLTHNLDGTPRKEAWSLKELVNEALKANARSNAYQAALLPYRPSEVSPEDIKERMVRDYIRLGVAEEVARKQVEALLAATSASA